MKRLTKRWGEQPYPNLAGKVICEYKECDSAKSCKDCVHGRIAERLAAYEDTGLEPEDILRILDAYGRGMTLRTESAQRLEIVKGIQTDRLRELAQADREGRCVVLPCEAGHEISYKSGIGLRCNAVIDEYTPENIFITAKTDIPNAEPLRQTFSLSEIEAALRREQE